MPNLFGLDIAGIVNQAIADAGGVLDATLTKVEPGTRDPTDLAGGTNPTTTDYACKGLFSRRSAMRIGESLVQQDGDYVRLLGASLAAGVVPEPGDTVTIEGATYTVLELTERDAAAATYLLRVGR